jgi:hypothetical protein
MINRFTTDSLQPSESVSFSVVRATQIDNWPRWILASIAKHFDHRRQYLPMFMEGEDHIENTPDYIELRVDGPYVVELTHGYYSINVEVNVLVCSAKNPNDLYSLQRNEGVVRRAFRDPIQVYRYGTGMYDDQGLLGCLVLVRSGDQREALRVSHFGQIAAETPIVRSSVEGHFYTQFKEI